jgi:4-carboxymuconolactone decarboxylase
MTQQGNTDARWRKGIEIVEKVYGPGSSAMMRGREAEPYVDEAVSHLFGEIWSRPGLSIRDKRLLVIGMTAMLGRADLIAIQVAGAIVNGELNDDELNEMPLLTMFYAGAGNATALTQGIKDAKATATNMRAMVASNPQ